MQGKVDVCFAAFGPPEQEHSNTPRLEEGDDVVVTADIRFSRLTADLRREISIACQEHGYNFTPTPVPLAYGIVRENAPESHFDPDAAIAHVLTLSRIVHPSTLGQQFCATLRFGASGSLSQISGHQRYVAYKPPSQRAWLTKTDCEEVAQIYNAYMALPVVLGDAGRLPARLHRALWNLSYAARVEPFHIRWLIMATALEGLIETGGGARQEFIQRVPAIGAEVGVGITRKVADEIYGLRSTVAHRGWIPERTDKELEDAYMPVDRVVAGVIGKAICDPDFRAAFESKESIARRWPVEATTTPEVM